MLHADISGSSRFRLLLKIASGGMGTVYLGQQRGAAGFQRLVAIKRAHPHLLEDAAVVKMLTMEARLASLVRHPNVVSVTDVEDADGELLLVMDYVEGASLSELNGPTNPAPMPLPIALRIVLDACEGLDALHQATDEEGDPLGIVHRDVSPQNVLVGTDGVARLADFGIARAYAVDSHTSFIRGKPGYMAPEYISSAIATPATDVFALGVVAWETLTRRRLYKGLTDIDAVQRVQKMDIPRPSSIDPGISSAIDDAVMRALAKDPAERFPTARDFGIALAIAARGLPNLSDRPPSSRGPNSTVATRAEVGRYVGKAFDGKLAARREMLKKHTPVDPSGFVPLESIGKLDDTPSPLTADRSSRPRMPSVDFSLDTAAPRLAGMVRWAAIPAAALLLLLGAVGLGVTSLGSASKEVVKSSLSAAERAVDPTPRTDTSRARLEEGRPGTVRPTLAAQPASSERPSAIAPVAPPTFKTTAADHGRIAVDAPRGATPVATSVTTTTAATATAAATTATLPSTTAQPAPEPAVTTPPPPHAPAPVAPKAPSLLQGPSTAPENPY